MPSTNLKGSIRSGKIDDPASALHPCGERLGLPHLPPVKKTNSQPSEVDGAHSSSPSNRVGLRGSPKPSFPLSGFRSPHRPPLEGLVAALTTPGAHQNPSFPLQRPARSGSKVYLGQVPPDYGGYQSPPWATRRRLFPICRWGRRWVDPKTSVQVRSANLFRTHPQSPSRSLAPESVFQAQKRWIACADFSPRVPCIA